MRTAFGTFVLLSRLSKSSAADTTYSATKYYHNACSGLPHWIIFSESSSCGEGSCSSLDPTGEGTAGSALFFKTTCNISNTAEHTALEFGSANTYVYFRAFDDYKCTKEQDPVGIRVYDGNCICRLVDESWAFSVDFDGAVQWTTYRSADCTGKPVEVFEWTKDDVELHNCRYGGIAYVHRPDSGDNIATTYFTDSSCKTPNRISFRERDDGENLNATTCGTDATGLYYSRDKDPTSDVAAFAKEVFGAQTTYLLVQEFSDEKCWTQSGWGAYRPDGGCVDLSGSGKNVSSDVAFDKEGDLVTRTFYNSSTCTGDSEAVSVKKSELDGQCVDGYRYFLKTPEKPTTTAPAPTKSASMRQSSSNVIVLSIAEIVTLVVAVAAPAFMA